MQLAELNIPKCSLNISLFLWRIDSHEIQTHFIVTL